MIIYQYIYRLSINVIYQVYSLVEPEKRVKNNPSQDIYARSLVMISLRLCVGMVWMSG